MPCGSLSPIIHPASDIQHLSSFWKVSLQHLQSSMGYTGLPQFSQNPKTAQDNFTANPHFHAFAYAPPHTWLLDSQCHRASLEIGFVFPIGRSSEDASRGRRNTGLDNHSAGDNQQGQAASLGWVSARSQLVSNRSEEGTGESSFSPKISRKDFA